MIEKLVLLSPVGLSSNYSDIKSTKVEDFMQEIFFKLKIPPTFLFKACGFLANMLSDYLVAGKCSGITKPVNKQINFRKKKQRLEI